MVSERISQNTEDLEKDSLNRHLRYLGFGPSASIMRVQPSSTLQPPQASFALTLLGQVSFNDTLEHPLESSRPEVAPEFSTLWNPFHGPGRPANGHVEVFTGVCVPDTSQRFGVWSTMRTSYVGVKQLYDDRIHALRRLVAGGPWSWP
jgi:hypothetical protein